MLARVGSAVVVMALVACQSDPLDSWTTYSVDPDVSTRLAVRHPDSDAVALRRLVSIGPTPAEIPFRFGHVTDVVFDQAGTLFVADRDLQKVFIFDSTGAFQREIGTAGSAASALLAPTKLLVIDSTLYIYDVNLRRIQVFDTGGSFRGSWPLEKGRVDQLAEGSSHELLAVIGAGDSAHVIAFDPSGKEKIRMGVTPLVLSLLRGPYDPAVGRVCQRDDSSVVFANPWIHEIATFNAKTGRTRGVVRFESSVIQPQRSTLRGVSPVIQRSFPLGFECAPAYTMLAYLDRRTATIYYDFFAENWRPIARISFAKGVEHEYPGILGDAWRDRVATFVTRPASRVSIYGVTIRLRT